MKKILCCLMIMIMCLGTFSSCKKGEDVETTQTTRPEITTQEVTEPAIPENMNLLTGKTTLSKGAYGKRPVAVMINNIKQSLPQYGIAAADILFEVEVEGGITRMMAIYGDYTKIPNVCSIRSCRYYFPIFASSFDAIYCCYGSNQSLGTTTLKRLNIDYFDGQYYSDLYARDQERLQTYSMEHTAYLKGEQVPAAIEREGMRSKLNDTTPFFNFNETAKKMSKKRVEELRLDFSDYYYTDFVYDKTTKQYLKFHNGDEHIDQSTDKQLGFTNVFILTTSVTSYEGQILRKVNWKGGNGYLLSKGTVKKIKWSKADEMSRFVITDVKGNEISINKGKSYFGVLNPEDVQLTVIEPETTAAVTEQTTAEQNAS